MSSGPSSVALRVVRPYETQEAFLKAEAATVAKTGVILLGAPQKPQGVILRFEIALASGERLIFGEGRVVGYREHAFENSPGLLLKFVRIDEASKAFVDRATESGESPDSEAPRTERSDVAENLSSRVSSPEPPAETQRDTLLERLRERRRSMTDEEVAAILDSPLRRG